MGATFNPNVDDHIKSSRSALISLALVTVFMLLNSLERISLARETAIYDRFLLEYWLLSVEGNAPFELGDGLENFSEDELNLDGLSLFAKIAHFRTALPGEFDQLCDREASWEYRGWKISLAEASCDAPNHEHFEELTDSFEASFNCGEGEQQDSREDCDEANLLAIQAGYSRPATLFLSATHDLGTVDGASLTIELVNEDWYVSTSNGCNLIPGKDFSISTETFANATKPKGHWDCRGLSRCKSKKYILSRMTDTMVARDGIDFDAARAADLISLQGYLEAMERQLEQNVSVPVVSITFGSRFAFYVSVFLGLLLLIWSNHVLSSICRKREWSATTTWATGGMARTEKHADLRPADYVSILFFVPLMAAKFVGYFLPVLVLSYLIYAASAAELVGTRSLQPIEIWLCWALLPLFFLLATLAVHSEIKIGQRLSSST